MNAFLNYLENKWLINNAELLDIIKHDQKYHIFQGTKPLLTFNGKEFIHESERVAQLIITDLMFREGEMAVSYTHLTLPTIYSV